MKCTLGSLREGGEIDPQAGAEADDEPTMKLVVQHGRERALVMM